MKATSIKELIEYLKKLNIEVKYEQGEPRELNRIIEIKIEGTTYFIEWWINQSYFKFKNEFSSVNLPFKYINVNYNSPTTKHRKQLCFYDVKNPNPDEFLYNEIPFGSLKIPFN